MTRPRATDEPSTIRRLAWFGVVVSYPFYLWRMAVPDWVTEAGASGPLAFAIRFAVGIGIVPFRLIESPPSAGRATHQLRPGSHGRTPWRVRARAILPETMVG